MGTKGPLVIAIVIALAAFLISCTNKLTYHTNLPNIFENIWTLDSMRIIDQRINTSEITLRVFDFCHTQFFLRSFSSNGDFIRQTDIQNPRKIDFAPYQLLIAQKKIFVFNFEKAFYSRIEVISVKSDSVVIASCNNRSAFRVLIDGDQMLLQSTKNATTELFFTADIGKNKDECLKQILKLKKLKCFDLIVPVYYERYYD